MIFYAHVVYVVIFYMSIICYMPVICLVQSPPQESVDMYANTMHPNRCMSTSIWDMSTSIWDTKLQTGGCRGLGYMIFNAHLCNRGSGTPKYR
jgi:SET domain-containing protein